MMDRRLELIVTEDGSHSLYVPELKETYHSFHGAIQESRHVFISQGLDFFDSHHEKECFKILEVGLGTGLNALLVAEWSHLKKKRVEMHSLEAYPVEESLVLKLNYAHLIGSLATGWFSLIHQNNWGVIRTVHPKFDLKKDEVKMEDAKLSSDYDVVFYDAFAPNKQSELWEPAMLEKAYNSLAKDGVFVTYCAKGQLKRDLKAVGFEVETLTGPPGKKEMVRAVKI